MKYRGKLGSRRTDRRLGNGEVNVRDIPWLREPHIVLGPDEWQIGGDAPKGFVVIKSGSGFNNAYIAKCPSKHGAVECVTEYVIACIGKMLPLRVAGARLIRMAPPAGVTCNVRFMSRYFLSGNERLMHGIEAVAECFEMKESEIMREIPRGKPQEKAFFTIDLIKDVLKYLSTTDEEEKKTIDGFARMIAFDALIGANDRHPKNWGLILSAVGSNGFRFAPVFDTARGLFWNFSDEQLAVEDRKERRKELIKTYANRSKPFVSLKNTEQPNHFDVIEYAMKSTEFQVPIRQVIRAFRPDKCAKMLHQKFGRLLSRCRLEHIDELLRYRHEQLRLIVTDRLRDGNRSHAS